MKQSLLRHQSCPGGKLMQKNGFTLLEVIAVLVVMGILAAVAMARITGDRGETAAAADTLKVHLRYAQFRAMHSDTSWGVSSTGGAYWLYSGGDPANRTRFPGEGADTVTMPAGGSSFTVSFNEWGMPFNAANPAGLSFADSAGRTIVVGSASDSVSITITANTGFIP